MYLNEQFMMQTIPWPFGELCKKQQIALVHPRQFYNSPKPVYQVFHVMILQIKAAALNAASVKHKCAQPLMSVNSNRLAQAGPSSSPSAHDVDMPVIIIPSVGQGLTPSDGNAASSLFTKIKIPVVLADVALAMHKPTKAKTATNSILTVSVLLFK